MNVGIDIVLLQLGNVIVRVSSFAICTSNIFGGAYFWSTFRTWKLSTFFQFLPLLIILDPQKLFANAPSRIDGTKYMYIHTYLCIYSCAYVYMYTCVYIYTYTYMYIYICMYICIYAYIIMWICICVCICMYLYI